MENPSLVYRLGSWTSPSATGWARGGGGPRRGDGGRDGVRRHRRAPSLAAVYQQVDGWTVCWSKVACAERACDRDSDRRPGGPVAQLAVADATEVPSGI
jgi:hypothetical protein